MYLFILNGKLIIVVCYLYKSFSREIKNQFAVPICTLQRDNAPDHLSN